MKVMDHVETLPYVDKSRVCAGGGSYGGYMTDWILGHTDRFRCLFSHAGVYNLTSEDGATEELWVPEWEFRGTPWSNKEIDERSAPPSSRAWSFIRPCSAGECARNFSTIPTRATGS